MNFTSNCPCGLNKDYSLCCGKYIESGELPKTAEQLMRSRYTAFTKSNINYIKNTMQGPALKKFNEKDARDWSKNSNWIKLDIINTHSNSNNINYVEFKAYYFYKGSLQIHHEKSQFKRIDNKWFYFNHVNSK